MSGPFKRKIFVGHLPDGCSEDELRRLFEECGEVTECDIVNKYAFVHMGTAKQANEAVKNLNNYSFMGSTIIVEFSKSKLHPEPGAPGRAIKRNVTRNVYAPPHHRSFSNTYEGRLGHAFRFRGRDRMRPYPPPFQQSNIGSDPFARPQPHMGMQDNLYMRRSPPLLSLSCRGCSPQKNEYEPSHGRGFSNSYGSQCFEGLLIARDTSYNHPFRFDVRDCIRPYSEARPHTPMDMHNDLYDRRSPPLSHIRMTAKEALADEEDNKDESYKNEVEDLNKKLQEAQIQLVIYENEVKQLTSDYDAIEEKFSQIKAENVALKDKICNLAIDLAFEKEGFVILAEVSEINANLPPRGELKRKDLQVGTQVWALKNKNFVQGTVKAVINSEEYGIEFEDDREDSLNVINSKQFAYNTISLVIIPLETRVLACRSNCMFAGVVAEIPKLKNEYRYLIFFDDGDVQYFQHNDIRIFCAQSHEVSNDMPLQVRDIIQSYFSKYPEWPLLKLQVNQQIIAEYEFKWLGAKVMKIDSSMVKIQFLESKRQEWIYRGSTRL